MRRRKRDELLTTVSLEEKEEDHIEKIQRYERLGKILAVLACFFSAFVLLPFSLKMVGVIGEDSNPVTKWRILIMFGGILVVIFLVSGRALVKDWKLSCIHRAHQQERQLIIDQTYKCIAPQILNRMVVFPLQVRRRDALKARFVRLTDEFVQVELTCLQEDPTADLQQLAAEVFGSNDVESVVWVGGGKAGPTGLAMGIKSDKFGSKLAIRIGQLIEDHIKNNYRSERKPPS